MKKTILALFALATMLYIGCPGPALLSAPEITSIIMNPTSVTVTWTQDTVIENDADFSGYNVYAYTDSADLLVTDGENLNKANGTVITDNTYEITGLSQDSIYYIQVRTVNTDDKVGDYNVDVPFVVASPRPEFTATIKFELGGGSDDSCAIKFSDATIMSDDEMATGDADMWIDYWGPQPDEDTTGFDSPSHHTQYGVGARVTSFVNLGQYDFDEIDHVTTEPTDTTFVAVTAGDLVIAKTADDNYVKIHVDALDDTLDYYVIITYAYQDNVDFPYFSSGK